ncbi:hypothetical protein [Subtercola vilae]|uniref:Uncharacterized protein n=1 Tax=Subtercola vilae TaxID=2056433 RepID=A0A4T2BMU8_9MICO|nr:hypothetical protein [Subtercola vilae]TIH32249.1 hypothetical protein D4765_15830 [Subtercola vilae]
MGIKLCFWGAAAGAVLLVLAVLYIIASNRLGLVAPGATDLGSGIAAVAFIVGLVCALMGVSIGGILLALREVANRNNVS